MKQILIVEDDSFLNKMVAYNLTADGSHSSLSKKYRSRARKGDRQGERPRSFGKNAYDFSILDRTAKCNICLPIWQRNFAFRRRKKPSGIKTRCRRAKNAGFS